MMIEEWKPIRGCEDLYEVSNFGNVRGLKRGKELSQFPDKKGYLIVGLSLGHNFMLKKRYVHQLVAKAFIEDYDYTTDRKVSHHKDLNKLNNHVDNLQVLYEVEHDKLHHEICPLLTRGCGRWGTLSDL
jgi:hypothetical protein